MAFVDEASGASESVSSDAGDNVLGSTAVRASADATRQVIKLLDGKRSFRTEMRYGTDLPPTNLIFDEDSRMSRLGQSEAAVEKLNAAQVRGRIEQAMIEAAMDCPMRTQKEIFDAVGGNAMVKYQVFGKLERDGVLAKSGNGVKGDPYRYVITDPAETEQDSVELACCSHTGRCA